MGLDLIDNKSEYIKIKAIYLWNNMDECVQQKYINQFKTYLDISYDFKELSIIQ